KRAGFGDRELAGLAGVGEPEIRTARLARGIVPGYAMVDTCAPEVAAAPAYAMVDPCAAEFAAETPYFYATYAAAGSVPEAPRVPRPAALVIGSGPVGSGRGSEFDNGPAGAPEPLRERGWQAVMINSNPETVSTD